MFKLGLLMLCLLKLSAEEIWSLQHTSFTSTDSIDQNDWFIEGNNVQFSSSCDSTLLFGGYNVFGAGAKVQRLITLPPHYKLRVSIQFWKIDSWDDEHVYFIFDDYVQTGSWYWSTGVVKCGNPLFVQEWREVVTNYEFTFSHNQKNLVVIITTDLDETPQTESWGFRDFKVEIQACSPGCLICNNDTPDECLYFEEIEANWIDSFNFDGWTLNQQQYDIIQQCLNVMIIGGINQFTESKKLSKQFINLKPHYKIILQVQLWKFDFWNNNIFYIEVDGQIAYQSNPISQAELTQLCGDNGGGEKLLNIHLEFSHSLNQMLITMKSNVVAINGSWGLRSFRLYLSKCYETCLGCSGPKINNCSICKDGYILHNFECVDVKWILAIKQYFNWQDFKAQDGWTILNTYNNQSPFQKCGIVDIVGGNNLFSKDAQINLSMDLPRHKRVRIQFQFWKIKSWDSEKFQVFANGILVHQMEFGKTGVAINCGSTNLNIYITNLDFEFLHSQPTIHLMMTSTLNETPDNKSWGIRNFQLLYGVAKDCSQSIIDFITFPSFIASSYLQSSSFSHDQTIKKSIQISELGLSLEPDFDQTVVVDKDLKKLTIIITWNCYTNDLNFSLIILHSGYPDYKSITTQCRHQRSNIVKSVLIVERTIPLQTEIKLIATSTQFSILELFEYQSQKLYDLQVN